MATLLAVTLPLSNYYSFIHYWNGIMVIDGYVLGIIPVFLNNIKYSKVVIKTKVIVFIMIVTVFYVLVALYDESNLLWVIKDIRPVIYLLTIVLISNVSYNKQFSISQSELNFIAIVAALSNVIWLAFGSLNLIADSSEDLYIQTNIYRYFDLSTYFSAYHLIYTQYIISSKGIKTKNTNLSIVLSFVSILISNSRMILIAVIICIGIVRRKKLNELFKYTLLATIVLVLFFMLSDIIGQNRIFESINIEGLLLQLENRYSPSLIAFSKMSEVNYIFGLGLGYFFEIPWFEYRGMDTHNASLDSSYLTHFVKQGFFGLLLLYIIIKRVSFFSFSKKLSASYMFFWFLIFLIAAPLYQNVMYGVLLYTICIKNSLNNYIDETKK